MKNILILFLLLTYSIYSQEPEPKEEPKSDSQSDRRMSRKWMLGVSPNHLSGRLNERKSLGLQYNWQKSFSFGMQYMHLDKHSSSGYSPSLIGWNNPESSIVHRFLHGYFKYYPFSSVVFLSGGVGRNFGHEKEKDTGYSFTYDRRGNTNLAYIISQSEDFNSYYYGFFSIGLEWIFANGITLGLDTAQTTALNRKFHSHLQVLPVQTNISNSEILQSIILFNLGNSSSRSSVDTDMSFIRFWIGYAF